MVKKRKELWLVRTTPHEYEVFTKEPKLEWYRNTYLTCSFEGVMSFCKTEFDRFIGIPLEVGQMVKLNVSGIGDVYEPAEDFDADN